MSRVANNPVNLPKGVEITLQDSKVRAKGAKGSLECLIPNSIKIAQEEGHLIVSYDHTNVEANMLAGTTRALLNNMILGVSAGFERKLELVGVGYRAQVQGSFLNLTLGFSHPVRFEIPQGLTIETPTQTEVLIKGVDKQQVGQAAAKIRAYRPPEPYKGKGVRYAGEKIRRKEAKKK
jgi:large subunit ribosomal protein L6